MISETTEEGFNFPCQRPRAPPSMPPQSTARPQAAGLAPPLLPARERAGGHVQGKLLWREAPPGRPICGQIEPLGRTHVGGMGGGAWRRPELERGGRRRRADHHPPLGDREWRVVTAGEDICAEEEGALRRIDSPANRAPAAWRRRSGTGAWA